MKTSCLILILALCMLPVTAFAAIEPSAGVDRNGTTITLSGDYEEYTITGSESGVSIIMESGVKSLKLEGASVAAPDGQDALTAAASLQLQLSGTSTIIGGSSNANGGRGIVLPTDGKLTISGDGSLNVSGGDTLYEGDNVQGKGGTAIVGSVTLQDDARVTVIGGSGKSGYWENNTWGGNGVDGNVEINGGQLNVTGGSAVSADYSNTGGHGINGNAVVNSGRLTATGGQGMKGRRSNKGGNGVNGSATVIDGQLTAIGGEASESSSTYEIRNYGGHGVWGDAEIYGGQLTTTGGQASGGEFTTSSSSQVMAGHGVYGNAVVNGGRLIATGNSASSPKDLKNIIGGNGINGAVTAAGGYVLATGGEGNSDQMGKAAAAKDASAVTIGSSGKLLAASVGVGTTPDAPLNNGEFYTAATNETGNVSGKRSLETKEYFTVRYTCAYDGCENTYTDFADSSKTYTVKTPASLGFQDHNLAFAGFVDSNGNMVESLTVSGPISLKASWKVVFTFDLGEGGTEDVPSIDAITSDDTIRLPECGFAAPDGYRFAGWKIDGDDKIYAVGDEIPAVGEIHLTAVWELIPVPPATGDSTMPVLWALLCLSACVMLLLRERAMR